METYLVGGAVRDELIGLPVRERDWCVVGATAEQMADLGYKPVGNDFPVFLHPQTNEEYALARTERKTGAGYHGFAFHAAPDVSIEDDLKRRDLTINAMAKDAGGKLIDPWGGQADIDSRVLRHVSESFVEDPVRILRVAKFAARFNSLGFRVAAETMQLMKEMVANGEVDALVPERVWQETEQALSAAHPRVFFEVLRECDALRSVFPEIDALFGVPQPQKWHPEIDCGIHAMMVVEQAAKLSADADVRFAALVHDLGKATTRKDLLPKHPGHEKRSVKLVKKLSQRLQVPSGFRELGCLAAEFHAHVHRAFELRPATVLKVLNRVDAFRRPDRFAKFLLVCEADARGRSGFEERAYPQADYFRDAAKTAKSVNIDDLKNGELSGEKIGRELNARRTRAIAALPKNQLPPK
ncbi:MAG: multifunctional CCA addition/repair protein [Woeseiaceae bacterium]|nr:multifunctional CCA addition/repair protein [Woeseiaceae bacterium]